MICWFCYWGWPKEVVEVYRRGVDAAGEMAMLFGPAHIVWEDENFETEHIEWCINQAQEHREGLSDNDVLTVVGILQELLEIPESIRCCEPEDYDGEHPERYPPPTGTIMIQSPKEPTSMPDVPKRVS